MTRKRQMSLRPWGRASVLLFGVAFLIAGNGCASSKARKHYKYQEAPRPYPAIRMNFGDPDWPVEAGGTLLNFDSLFSCLIIPFDLPISFVTDTFLLPLDLSRWRKEIVNAQYVSNALYSAKMPSVDEFRRHYIPAYSLRVVNRYVFQPPEQIAQERLDMLLDAGVSVSLLSASSRLDEDFTDRLVDRILAESDSTNKLLTLVLNKNIPAATLRRLAGLYSQRLLFSVAGHERTPPDVLRDLAKDPSCAEPLAGNPSTPPDVLYRMAESTQCVVWVLRNNSTPPEALLKLVYTVSPEKLQSVARHTNATAAVCDAVIDVGKQAFARGGLSVKERYWVDLALAAVAGRSDIPTDRLLALAALPSPTMLVTLACNRNADTNTLTAIVATCSQVDTSDSYRSSFDQAVEYVQRRFQQLNQR